MKPWESSYATFANDPIYYNDLNGDQAGNSPIQEAVDAKKEKGGFSFSNIFEQFHLNIPYIFNQITTNQTNF